MTKAKIVNVVATAELKQNVDLGKIGSLKYGIHDDLYYGGRIAYIKTPDMSGRVTIFANGKMISVGTRSGLQALRELRRVAQILAETDLIKPISLRMKIRNVVATADFGKAFDLNKIAKKYSDVVYEPEQFPGAICKWEELSDATVLLFASGKAVITGIRRTKSLDLIVDQIMCLVNSAD